MDLQSILDDSDSSSFEAAAGVTPTVHDDDDSGDVNSNFDIEDILREDDDDDDDDDDEDDDDNNDAMKLPIWKLRSPHMQNHSLSSSRSRSLETKESLDLSKISSDNRRNTPPTRTFGSSHNPEDWAVLQQILNEDEDDDDDDNLDRADMDDWMSTASKFSSFPTQPDRQTNISAIDDMVRQVDDDDEEKREDVEANAHLATDTYRTLSASHVPMPSQRPLEATVQERKHDTNERESQQNDTAASSKAKSTDQLPSLFQRNEGIFRKSKQQQQQRVMTEAKEEDKSVMDEEIYRQSLAMAQAAERKLLKSGHREIVSPLMIKRRLKPRIELAARYSKQQKQHPLNGSTLLKNDRTLALTGPRFGFSGLVEFKKMTSVSASLVKHADREATKVLCGLPTCLAFNSKFIAIGTQLGIILVFDLFEVLRQRLGATAYDDGTLDRSTGSITSLDLAHNGDTIIAGYTSGMLVLWDTIRGTVLRSVGDYHPSPITAVRFVGELKMVTVDSGGLVHKLTFTKNIIWSTYSVEADCLLDGTAGQILAMHVLPPFSTVKPMSRPEALTKLFRNLSLIALSSARSSFTVAVEPKINVLHRWGRPPADLTKVANSSNDDDKPCLPCLSWGWALISGGGNVVMPILARAWGCCLQLLCASFPTFDDAAPVRIGEEPVIHWPAFGVHKEIDAAAPIVALEWLNDRSLAYLTASNEFTLVDTVMMTLQERLDFSGLKLVYAEFSLSRGAVMNAGDGQNSTLCTTFLNSTRCSDDRIMMICQDELRCISIVGARRRISSLEADGEWLEALAFALDHYENTVISQEDRWRDPLARRDLSRHPEFSAAKSDEEEWIAKLLIRYLNLAVENAPESSSDHASPYSSNGITSRIDLAQSHFQMLAGVCVEFCVATRRLDLLFGSIFRRFQSVGYIAVFLDVLEPYVLNDKLKYIAPEVMSFFVEHCKATNGIATVERCLLHMDCTIMDFDSILSLLRANEMFSAMFYVFNQGLDDYVSPLEIVLEKVFNGADAGGASLVRHNGGKLQNDFERFGYKALFYLQTCFSGKSFPQESTLQPEERANSVKLELLRFLMQESYTPSSYAKKAVNLIPTVGQRAFSFPYIRILLLVDPRGTLDTLSMALDSINNLIYRARSESLDDWVDGGHSRISSHTPLPDLQEIMIDLATILLPKSTKQSLAEAKVFQSRGAANAFLDFATKYLINGTVHFDKSITFMVLSRVANQYAAAGSSDGRPIYQRKIMDILSALPRDSYDPDDVLAVFKKAGMHRASLLLHQQVASSWHDADEDNIELRSRHFLNAIDCYAEDDDPVFRLDVFNYIRKECSGVNDSSPSIGIGERPKTIRDALFTRLSVLVNLDAVMTTRLVAELFVDNLDRVIASLESDDGGKRQFMFLHAVVSGDLGQSDPVAGAVLNLSMEHHHKYLSLMTRLHPEMVYEYLSTHDNYRTEEALRLCEAHDIADASAYLLERMGKVTNALQLILQTLETRMMGLKRSIRGLGIDVIRHHANRPFSAGRQSRHLTSAVLLPSKHDADVVGVRRILIVALDLCERNSGTTTGPVNERSAKFAHGELWFSVLDRLINAKGFLRLSKELPEHANVMAGVLSELLHVTMERMVSSVPLPDLVRKVTSDHSGSQIGELREMVHGLLSTYGFELNVFRGAISVFHADVHSMRKAQQGLQVQGDRVEAVMNSELKSSNVGKVSDVTSALLHPSQQSGVLRVTGHGNATVVENDRFSSSARRAENGLVDAMKRLRSRRSAGVDGRNSDPGDSALSDRRRVGVDLSMMTMTEKLYRDKAIEPVLFGERPVGALGEAEHRGRLVTFTSGQY